MAARSSSQRTPLIFLQARLLALALDRAGLGKRLRKSITQILDEDLHLVKPAGTNHEFEWSGSESGILPAIGAGWFMIGVLGGLGGLLATSLGAPATITGVFALAAGVSLSEGLLLSSFEKFGFFRLWTHSIWLLDLLWLGVTVACVTGFGLALLA